MKTFKDIVLSEKKITITLAQLNLALMKIGIGPKIVGQLMVALNVARGLGIVEKDKGGWGMKTYQAILFEKLKLKRVSTGSYECNVGRIKVEVYKAELADYWSSTITVGKYGDDDWREESFQAYTKRELVKGIEKFIREHS
jgi:hypothetical protein